MITGEKSARRTERRLAALEGRLRGLYEHTADDMQKKADAFFKQFERLDAEKRKKVDAGKLDAEKYKEWRKNKILYSRRFSDFQKKTAQDLSRVNETALSYINGEVPPVYADNCNDFGKSISAYADTKFDIGISFDLVDADTVRILAADNDNLLPELPPEKMLDIPLDERWNRQNMRTELAKGILEGESIPDISARMRKVVGMNHTSAVRNARTMVTAAQNGGRMEGMRRAESMGIVLKRIWMSAEDRRVRKAHAELDGQTRSMDEAFHNAIGEIMYPGDPHAHPANVYNCRCTLGTEIVGFRDSATGRVRRI